MSSGVLFGSLGWVVMRAREECLRSGLGGLFGGNKGGFRLTIPGILAEGHYVGPQEVVNLNRELRCLGPVSGQAAPGGAPGLQTPPSRLWAACPHAARFRGNQQFRDAPDFVAAFFRRHLTGL